jgi:small-conductance mechanosensitive channel
MGHLTTVRDAIIAQATSVLDRAVEQIPAVLGAVVLLLLGWIVAHILRAATARMFALAQALGGRLLATESARRHVTRSTGTVETIVFWVVLLFFITAATRVLGLDTFAVWLSRLLEYVPTLLTGALIVAAGWLLSRVVADVMVMATTGRLEAPARELLARMAQVTILVVAILVGAEQVGIRITVLVILMAALAMTVVAGITVAISLGARVYVANLIGAHYLRQAFELGQRIRVGGFEGRVLDVSATAVVLETTDGRVTLPGQCYHNEPIVLLEQEPTRG